MDLDLLPDDAPAELVEELNEILSDVCPAGQKALLRAGFAEHDLRDGLPRTVVPTVLPYSEQDVRAP